MLELAALRADPETIKQGLSRRDSHLPEAVDTAVHLDREWRALVTRQQTLKTRSNQAAKAIGTLMRQGKRAEAETQKQAYAVLKQDIAHVTAQSDKQHQLLQEALLAIPNVPHASVPSGHTADENHVVSQWGPDIAFDFTPLAHWELAEKLHLVDFQRGAKVSGAGFPFYVGAGAMLQRALLQFFLTEAAAAGYCEIQPPLLVNEASAQGTGQLPDKEGQMYRLQEDPLYLIPTAEVPLTNFYRGEILPEADLPLKLCGHTPCWRREAGSYGKHVRGLNRLHQFDKVEIVQITRPEDSYEALEAMVAHAEMLLQKLGLPFRRLLMCAGEMGFNQTKQYDLEVWSAGQSRWLEVSSVSNFETYQANRLKLRCRSEVGQKPRLAHTLNGSALALPRVVAALLENSQQPDGSVRLPDILRQHARRTDEWVIHPQQ